MTSSGSRPNKFRNTWTLPSEGNERTENSLSFLMTLKSHTPVKGQGAAVYRNHRVKVLVGFLNKSPSALSNDAK